MQSCPNIGRFDLFVPKTCALPCIATVSVNCKRQELSFGIGAEEMDVIGMSGPLLLAQHCMRRYLGLFPYIAVLACLLARCLAIVACKDKSDDVYRLQKKTSTRIRAAAAEQVGPSLPAGQPITSRPLSTAQLTNRLIRVRCYSCSTI